MMNKYLLRAPVLLGIFLAVFFIAEGSALGQQVASGQRGTGFIFDLASAGAKGARALGMGGAFIAFADDVTAATENPAGLPQLEEPRISANLKMSSPDNPAAVDFGGTQATFGDRVSSPTFLGYAHPFGNAAVAVYYEQSVKSLVHSEFEENVIPINFIGETFLVEEQLSIENLVHTFGGSFGYSFGDAVAVGASLRLSSLDWDQSRSLTLTDFDNRPDSVTLDIDLQEVESRDLTFSFGALINPSGALRGGFIYKEGAEFDLERTVTPSCDGLSGPLCNPINFTVDDHALVMPSTIGGGVSYNGENFRVGGDIAQLRYADLEDTFEFIFGFSADEPLDDVIQVRAGGEYGFGDPREARGFVRAGIFTKPDHDGLADIDSDGMHFTFGGGGLFSENLALDGALTIGEGNTEALFSLEVLFR